MKKVLWAALAASTLAMATPAMAVPIAAGSNLSIGGIDNVTATQITFPGSQRLDLSFGSFAGLGSCVACVALNTITYSPAVSSGLLFTINNNFLTATFTLDSGAMATVKAGSPGSIDILGTGIATLTGFEATRGNIAFTTQNGVTNAVTFSATVVAVPEPISLGLFGAGLLGLGLVRRARKQG